MAGVILKSCDYLGTSGAFCQGTLWMHSMDVDKRTHFI